MKEKRGMIIVCIMIVISMLIAGCIITKTNSGKEPFMTLEPEVKVTETVYYQLNCTGGVIATPEIWGKFNDEYGARYSRSLRDKIIASMLEQAEELGEKPGELEKCVNAAGKFDEYDSPRLPCYAEKATYEFHNNFRTANPYTMIDMNESELGPKETEPCWVFVFNWGIESEHLGHIATYIVSAVDFSTLIYETCD